MCLLTSVLFCGALLLPQTVLVVSTDEKFIVKTNYGLLLGKPMTSNSGRHFHAFLGVPFAAPPVGSLRFLPPQPPEKWEGVKNATVEGNKCLQKYAGGSENCLFLNVFTHGGNKRQTHAVMVFIHGGGFHMGSSSIGGFGPEYLMDKGIVLVTLQYRLGVFGFLSTGDEIVTGNMGLKDQVKALEWIKENIQSFGGDPDKVTVFGNSAGASSVHFHMLSPLSETLFARAISQSGTALSSFAMTNREKAKKDTEKLAADLSCAVENSTELLECLQNRSSSQIMTSFEKQLASRYGANNKIFRPVVEQQNRGAFLTTSPLQATTNKPWLVGVNANEGILKLETEHLNQIIIFTHSDFTNFGPEFMFINDLYSNLEEIANMVYSFYFGKVSTTNDTITALEQLVSDSWFVWPTVNAIREHNGPLYYYLYNHTGEHSYAEVHNWVKGFGVSHMDELLVLFTQKKYFPKLNPQDENVSKFMIDCWVNFATVGDPTPDNVSEDPQSRASKTFKWLHAGTDSSYVHIETNKLAMENGMFSERMNFWKNLPKRYLY